MTVCTAAIGENGVVVGASDRLLTSEDVQFEPSRSKIFTLTDRIVILVSGDMSLLDEILNAAVPEMLAKIAAQPDRRPLVSEVAQIYQAHYRDIRQRKSELAILAPVGLTLETFISRQKEMQPDFINRTRVELLSFEPSQEGAQAIFAGVDDSGSHLYVADGANLSCRDTVGFAAIGIGFWHAASQFMFAGHTSSDPINRTILQAYWAKKRAEVAPGVGQSTDMFIITPGRGLIIVSQEFIAGMEQIYRRLVKQEARGRLKIEERFTKRFEEVVAAIEARRGEPTGTEGVENDD